MINLISSLESILIIVGSLTSTLTRLVAVPPDDNNPGDNVVKVPSVAEADEAAVAGVIGALFTVVTTVLCSIMLMFKVLDAGIELIELINDCSVCRCAYSFHCVYYCIQMSNHGITVS